MAIEAATHISNLDDANPTGSDDYATADNHIRMIKTVLQTQFPNFGAQAVLASVNELNSLDGYTGNVADLNVVAGAAAAGITPTELAFLNGVTSGIQAQIDTKAASAHTHAAADVVSGAFADARIPNLNASKITAGILAAARIPTHTGDVTGQTALTIAADAVTLAKMANMATDSFLGRDTAGSGNPEVLSATAARAILGVESGATADQTNAEIRTAVEAATDSNVFTDADHSKLNGVEASATADQTNGEIKTAYEANADTNAFTNALLSKLNGIAAGATVDQVSGNGLTGTATLAVGAGSAIVVGSNDVGVSLTSLAQFQANAFVAADEILVNNGGSNNAMAYSDSGVPISVVSGTTDTLVTADMNRFLHYTNAGAVAVTLNDSVGIQGNFIIIKQGGAGQVTVSGTAALESAVGVATRAQNSVIVLYCQTGGASAVWAVYGDGA